MRFWWSSLELFVLSMSRDVLPPSWIYTIVCHWRNLRVNLVENLIFLLILNRFIGYCPELCFLSSSCFSRSFLAKIFQDDKIVAKNNFYPHLVWLHAIFHLMKSLSRILPLPSLPLSLSSSSLHPIQPIPRKECPKSIPAIFISLARALWGPIH